MKSVVVQIRKKTMSQRNGSFIKLENVINWKYSVEIAHQDAGSVATTSNVKKYNP